MNKKNKLENLSEALDSYYNNYKRVAGRFPSHIPITEEESQYMKNLIADYMQKNPNDTSVYYVEDGSENTTILVWRGCDLYVTEGDNAKTQRESIR